MGTAGRRAGGGLRPATRTPGPRPDPIPQACVTEAPGEKWSEGGTGGFTPGSRQLPRFEEWGRVVGSTFLLGSRLEGGSGRGARESQFAKIRSCFGGGRARCRRRGSCPRPPLSWGCTDPRAAAPRASSFPAPPSRPRVEVKGPLLP